MLCLYLMGAEVHILAEQPNQCDEETDLSSTTSVQICQNFRVLHSAASAVPRCSPRQ